MAPMDASVAQIVLFRSQAWPAGWVFLDWCYLARQRLGSGIFGNGLVYWVGDLPSSAKIKSCLLPGLGNLSPWETLA